MTASPAATRRAIGHPDVERAATTSCEPGGRCSAKATAASMAGGFRSFSALSRTTTNGWSQRRMAAPSMCGVPAQADTPSASSSVTRPVVMSARRPTACVSRPSSAAGSLSRSSVLSQATGRASARTQSAIRALLPNPAGATSATSRVSRAASSRWSSRGRGRWAGRERRHRRDRLRGARPKDRCSAVGVGACVVPRVMRSRPCAERRRAWSPSRRVHQELTRPFQRAGDAVGDGRLPACADAA